MDTIIIEGKYNTIEMVDPEECFFVAEYENGDKVRGGNLLNTGWSELKDGFKQLSYKLSNGKLIQFPKFKRYLHLVEVSQSLESGKKIFHSVNIKGTNGDHVINYRVVLRQYNLSKHKIGDVVVTKEDKIIESPYWKIAA
jgi:hypothetical protein